MNDRVRRKAARNAEAALRDWHARTGTALVCSPEALDAFEFAGLDIVPLVEDGVLLLNPAAVARVEEARRELAGRTLN